MRRIISCLFVLFLMVVCCCVTATGENTSPQVTVELKNPLNEQPVVGTKLELFMVAEFTDINAHQFIAEKDFKNIVDTLDMSTTEKTCTYKVAMDLLKEISEKNISCKSSVNTDDSGKVIFENLKNGIYLVNIPDCDKFEVNSFVLEVPLMKEGEVFYSFTAAPKLSVEGSSSKSESESSSDASSVSESMPDSSSKLVDSEQQNSSINEDKSRNPHTGILGIGVGFVVVIALAVAVVVYTNKSMVKKNKK